MCFPTDRVALALVADPRVERLLICNQPRSAPIKLVKDACCAGRRRSRPASTSTSTSRCACAAATRPRLRDLERTYAPLRPQPAAGGGAARLERPAVITAHPFVAAFAALEWAGPVTLLATDDWAAHPAYERWQPAYLAAYERIARAGAAGLRGDRDDRRADRAAGPAAVVPNGVDPAQWLQIAPPRTG